MFQHSVSSYCLLTAIYQSNWFAQDELCLSGFHLSWAEGFDLERAELYGCIYLNFSGKRFIDHRPLLEEWDNF